MVDNKIWIGITILSLITALGVIGYNINDKTYFCKEKGIVMDCVRFSESGLRCYPNLLDNKGYKDCSEGWIQVTNDLKIQENETEPIEPPIPGPIPNSGVISYLCPPRNENKPCEAIR